MPSSISWFLVLASVRAQYLDVDVLVYTANPAGIGASIAAADGGKNSVLLMEPLLMLGGMGAAGGVGLMNQGCGNDGISGLGRAWGFLNGAYYQPGPNPPLNLFPDPSVMEHSFWVQLNQTKGIDVRLGCRLLNVTRGSGACLSQAAFACGETRTPPTPSIVTVMASIFIDASYDGDVMAGAGGIDYAWGRESSSEFNESLAGVQLLDESNESFDKQNLTIVATFPNGTLLPGITSDPLLPVGSADDRLMAFSYFPCVTSNASNSIPYPRPVGYNPDDFTLLLRQIEGVVANGKYPNGPDLSYFSESHYYSTPGNDKLLLCCGVGPVNCDEPDLNHGWATANYTQRQAIAERHKYYLLGSLYFMATDDRVPNFTRYAVGRWGLCADQYTDSGYWPPQIYVRTSNRLRGEFLITQNNIVSPRNKQDGVSMACWEFDQHTMSRHAIPDPNNGSQLIAVNEGYMRNDLATALPCSHPDAQCTASGNWYDVPFGVMLPKRGQASNLLVPVAISSTSIAYSSTRIEGMYMDLGTAAGVAAALALDTARGGPASSPMVRGACPAFQIQDTNVTAVQAILVNTFQQRVHGPATAPLSVHVTDRGE